MKAGLAVLLVAASVVAAKAPGGGRLDDWRVIEDSLREMPPRLRYYWLRDRGLDDWYNSASAAPDSQGLECVGRWSFGPASDVDGRILPGDTLLALARGSGVSLVRFSRQGGLSLEVLADVNCDRLAGQVLIRDTLLYVASYGLEVYGISDPAHPVRHSRLETSLLGFDVVDTLVYVTTYDSFKVYSAADPTSLELVGACRDSGAAVSVAGGTAFVANAHGLYAIDVSDPTAPHRVGQWGSRILSVTARGTICCVTQDDPSEPVLTFTILNATNPANMQPLASLDSCGGYDVHLDDTVAFASGYYSGGNEFRIICISDSTNPRELGTCATLGSNYGIWGSAGGRVALVADGTGGMAQVDLVNPGSPRLDTIVLRAGFTEDVALDRDHCYVGNTGAGMKVLDVADPTRPVWVGDLDTAFSGVVSFSVAARDSFAYTCWSNPYLRVVDVTDPTAPQMAGACAVFRHPEDMVLSDSFLYVAEDYRFQVVNVARPRQPQVVATCNLPDYTYGMCLRESLAYVSTYPLSILNVASPTQPVIVGSIPRGTWSVFVQDSLAYLAAVGLHVWNVGNPAAPVPVDSLTFGHMVFDVAVVDTLAYLSCSDGLRLASVADPHNMRVLAFHSLPYTGGRLVWDTPYVYVAVRDAGVCVFETTQTGIVEVERNPASDGFVRFSPNPVERWLSVEFTGSAGANATVYDMAGREVRRWGLCGGPDTGGRLLDLNGLVPGVYVLRLDLPDRSATAKVVKR